MYYDNFINLIENDNNFNGTDRTIEYYKYIDFEENMSFDEFIKDSDVGFGSHCKVFLYDDNNSVVFEGYVEKSSDIVLNGDYDLNGSNS